MKLRKFAMRYCKVDCRSQRKVPDNIGGYLFSENLRIESGPDIPIIPDADNRSIPDRYRWPGPKMPDWRKDGG